jgi:hypothetical protein
LWTQRISVLSSLKPLPQVETERYMEHRLRVAGFKTGTPFTARAKKLISELSEGIPRNINNLCFGALSLGCALQQKTIDMDVIREVVADLDLSRLASESRATTIQEAALLQNLKDNLGLVAFDKTAMAGRADMLVQERMIHDRVAERPATDDVPSVAEAQNYIQEIIQLLNNWQRSVN